MNINKPKVATRRVFAAGVGALAAIALAPSSALAASSAILNQDAEAALQQLYAASPRARELAARSRAVLIFPKIVKAGFVVGAQTGDGVMRVHGSPIGYYNISAGSFGLQAGAQTFSFVMFFISQSAVDYLEKSQGWQIGTGPSFVVVDQGMAGSLNTTNLTQDVYVMTFGQKGLMAGLGLEGSKITEIYPGP